MTYHLTEAGRELEPIGQRGIRWIGELGDQDLDPHLLLWDIHRNIDLEAVPDGRTVVQFSFTGHRTPAREWRLVITAAGVDVCDFDPGYDVQVTVQTPLRILTLIWLGDLEMGQPSAPRTTARPTANPGGPIIAPSTRPPRPPT